MIGSLEPIIQKYSGDCVVAALAMALNQPYRLVSEAAVRVAVRPHTEGLWDTDMLRIARTFGAKFKRVYVADEVTGLVVVGKGRGKTAESHCAALFQGVVINPSDGLLWDLDTFVADGGWSVVAIWERIA
jgi:hypothetical protein